MSDQRHDDWTDGPELSAEAARARRDAAQTAAGADDESVRLAEIRLLDRWIGDVLAEQRRSRRWKIFFRLLFAGVVIAGLALSAYGLLLAQGQDAASGERHLGVVDVSGPIDAQGQASAERIIEGLRRAWRDPDSEAVVLHINSPGGSPVQSQRVYDEIRYLEAQGDKPILAVIEDIGASGAYYMASAADRIYASPASLVGSIGVISAGFGLQGAIDKLGVERRVFTAGENKAFLDPFSPVAPAQREFWQSVLDTTHQQFIDAVKSGRGKRLSDDPRIFSGLIWTGQQALQLGLIDDISNLEQLSRSRLGKVSLEDYTPALDPWSLFSQKLTQAAAHWLGISEAASPVRYQLP
ncbi:signal peptide peptidase SppA [Salinicola sp. JS01]|uniref:signal peptide peptidase SppA n=1 Tax=Salinicola sp. JS01 TaxID=3050071 RepID=UPI00255BF459|nr:signal peptide peptidase SppA [Salinicola sp. JS01]WIX34481.1 signal peptide peptidase SppA [Salinicola sp. JS01]